MKLLICLVFFIGSVLYASEESLVGSPNQIVESKQHASLPLELVSALSHLERGDYERAIQGFMPDLNSSSLAFEIQSLLKARLVDFLNTAGLVGFNNNHNNKTEHLLNYYEKALEEYNSALKQDKASLSFDTLYRKAGDIVNEQGKKHLKAERLDMAYKSFQLALAFYPGFAKAYNNSALVIAQKSMLENENENIHRIRLHQALHWHNRAIHLDSTVSAFYANRGIALLELGALYRASQDFDRAIQLDPLSISAYGNRGSFYARQGQSALALRDLNKTIELIQKSPLATNSDYSALAITYYNRGMAYYNLRQWGYAIEDFQSALRSPFLSSPPPEQGIIKFRSLFFYIPSYDMIMAYTGSDYLKYDTKVVVEKHLRRAKKAQNKANQKPNRFFSFCARVFSK